MSNSTRVLRIRQSTLYRGQATLCTTEPPPGHHAQCERVKQTMEMFSCFYYLQHFGKHGITYELSGLENFR